MEREGNDAAWVQGPKKFRKDADYCFVHREPDRIKITATKLRARWGIEAVGDVVVGANADDGELGQALSKALVLF